MSIEMNTHDNGDREISDLLIILYDPHSLKRHQPTVGVAVHNLCTHILHHTDTYPSIEQKPQLLPKNSYAKTQTFTFDLFPAPGFARSPILTTRCFICMRNRMVTNFKSRNIYISSFTQTNTLIGWNYVDRQRGIRRKHSKNEEIGEIKSEEHDPMKLLDGHRRILKKKKLIKNEKTSEV